MKAKRYMLVMALMLPLIVMGISGCTDGEILRKKRENARWWLNERISYHESHRFEPREAQITFLNELKKARAVLKQHPRMSSDKPHLILAQLFQFPKESPYAQAIDVTWMERGFNTVGMYLKNEDGDIIEVIDEQFFQDRLKRDYSETFLKVVYLRLKHADSVSNPNKGLSHTPPFITVPRRFINGETEVGLIVEGGQHLPSEELLPRLIKPGTADQSAEAAGRRGKGG